MILFPTRFIMKTAFYRIQFPDHPEYPDLLSVLWAMPDEGVRYTLQIVHGISETKERYMPLIEFMTAHGAEVIIHDLPGHGHTAQSQDALGIMGDPGYDYRNLRLGIDGVYASLHTRSCGNDESGAIIPIHDSDLECEVDIPRFLLGHSMGSLIAGLYTAREAESIDGLILTGLPFRHRSASIGVFLMTLLEGIFGEDAKPKWINKVAFEAYNRRFTPEPQSDGQFMWLSCDIDNRYAFLADPLCNYNKSISTFTNLLRMVRDFYRPASWDMRCPDLPILLLAGEQDPVAGSEKKFSAGISFLRDIGFRNVSGFMFRGFRHEILRDWCREEAFDYVLRFCEDNLEAAVCHLEQLRDEYKPQFAADEEEQDG